MNTTDTRYVAGYPAASPQEGRQSTFKIMTSAGVGHFIEWFDFGLYGTLAAIILLREAEDRAAGDQIMLVNPEQRSARAFFPPGRTIARIDAEARASGEPALDIGIRLRAERDLGQVKRHRPVR